MYTIITLVDKLYTSQGLKLKTCLMFNHYGPF